MRFLKAQQRTLDHHEEEREINRVLCQDCFVNAGSDERNLENSWVQGDATEDIVEGLDMTQLA